MASDWRKRKKRREIAHHYGYDHYWEYKRNIKFAMYYLAFQDDLDNGLIDWSEVLPRMNRMFCKAGFPQYCMTQEEWYAKVMEGVNERERRQDESILQFCLKNFDDHKVQMIRYSKERGENNAD